MYCVMCIHYLPFINIVLFKQKKYYYKTFKYTLLFLESNDISLKSKWLNTLCCLESQEYFFMTINDNLCANLCKTEKETQITLKCLR